MTYRQNFVVCIKVNGKILREFDSNTVLLPFGAEYSILLKNLDSRRAVVSISVDGTDIGGQIVVEPNTGAEIERFIAGNLEKGYKFKFIEKTTEISEHRGDNVEDGVIRVSYQFEQRKPQPIIREEHHHHHHHHDHYKGVPPWTPPASPIVWMSTSNPGGSAMYGATINDSARTMGFMEHDTPSMSMTFGSSATLPANTNGITVNGDDSNQKFSTVYVGPLENETFVICMNLKGLMGTSEQVVVKPVTVEKIKCSICGRMSSSANKFCPHCSTRLVG